MVKKKSSRKKEPQLSHMSFELPVELRNTFKAKVASEGKLVKDVLIDLIQDYVKSKK